MPRKTKVGKVVSDKNAKTIVVEVHRRKKHPRYHKYIKVRKRFMAHDEEERATVGDIVRIIESRPLSARKRWELAQIVSRGVGPEVQVKDEEGLAEVLGHKVDEQKADEKVEQAEGETVEEIVGAESEPAPAAEPASAAEPAPATATAPAAEPAPATATAPAAEPAPATATAPATEPAPAPVPEAGAGPADDEITDEKTAASEEPSGV